MARNKGPRSKPAPGGEGADDQRAGLDELDADQPTGAWSQAGDTDDDQGWETDTGYWTGTGAGVDQVGDGYPPVTEDEYTGQVWQGQVYRGYEGDEGWEQAETGYYEPQYYEGADEAQYYEPHDHEDGDYEDRDYQGRYYDDAAYEGAAYQDATYQMPAVPPAPARRRRRANGPWPELVVVTALAVVAAAVVLAYMTGSRNQRGASAAQTTAPPTSSSSTSSTRPRTSTSGGTTTLAPPSQAAQRLPVTPGVEQSIVKSWLATNPGSVGIAPKDVAGTVPGEVYYARQPALGTYWALAAFQPSAQLTAERSTAAGQAKLAEFQGIIWVFTWRAGPTWTELGQVSTGQCPDIWVPSTVLSSWGLCGLQTSTSK